MPVCKIREGLNCWFLPQERSKNYGRSYAIWLQKIEPAISKRNWQKSCLWIWIVGSESSLFTIQCGSVVSGKMMILTAYNINLPQKMSG
jgi:hypothetical protein